jgi:hypothetical protein
LLEALGWGVARAMPPPVVTPTDQTVAYNQSVALSNMFSVSGSGITQYQVWFSWPEGGLPADGTVTVNGTAIARDQWVTVGSLSSVVYTGSATPGHDVIWVRAYNGSWSNEPRVNITDPGTTSTSHSSAFQLSGLGNEPGKLDQAVALLTQYMATPLGQSDFGRTNHLNVAFQDPSTFLTPPAQDHSRHA